MDWQAEWQLGVMADSPALIPLVGNNSRFDSHFQCKCLYLYKVHGGWVSPSAQPVWLPNIYLFTLYNPNGLYSNNPPPNPKGCS